MRTGRVLDFVNQSDWKEELLLVARHPTLAQDQGDFGMFVAAALSLYRAVCGPLLVAIKAKAHGCWSAHY